MGSPHRTDGLTDDIVAYIVYITVRINYGLHYITILKIVKHLYAHRYNISINRAWTAID